MKKSALEFFTQAYIRTHNRLSLSKKAVQRAIALVDIKLDNPCCDDSSATTDLVTKKRGVFLNTFEKILDLTPKVGNIRSLQQTKKLLQKNIGDPCCD